MEHTIEVDQSFELPNGYKGAIEHHDGEYVLVYYSAEGGRFCSMAEVKEFLKTETDGLPIGWKRVKRSSGIVFAGPDDLELDHLYKVYEYEAERLRPKPNSMTKQWYFTHAVCGRTPAEHDDLWVCYSDFLVFISTVLRMNFHIGIDIIKLRGDAVIPPDMVPMFGDLVQRLSAYASKPGLQKLRFRIKKNRDNGYRVKDAVDLFKRLTDVIFPRTDGCYMFVPKPHKINDGFHNGKRKQAYVYTFRWKHVKENVARYSVRKECVMGSIRSNF